MVWKSLRKIVIFIALAVILVQPISASAYDLYDGTISTTYITIFRDIATKIPIDKDYVFFRSGQYEYVMVVGDFDYSQSSITSSDSVTVYSISTNSSYNNNYYHYTVSNESSFSLNTGDGLIYSNLGNYPDLIERNDTYALATVFLLLIGICIYLVRSILSFCLRNRKL